MNVQLSRRGLSVHGNRINLDLILGERKLDTRTYPKPARSQTRHPLGGIYDKWFNAYQPLKHNLGLFSLLRSEIPFFNVAIRKLVMLIGDPIITSKQDRIEKKIQEFIATVKVGYFGQGLGAFLDEIEDSAFELGMGFGELIPTATLTDVWGLKIARATDFRFVVDEKTDEVSLATYRDNSWQPVKLENPDLVYYLAFDRRQGHPQGYSLLYSCIAPGQTFLRWEKSFENVVIRAGDPTHFITIKAGENTSKEEAEYIRDDVLGKLSEIMQLRKKGQYGDMGVCVPHGGTAEHSTLGNDAKLITRESDLRTILEQLISNTGLPPSSLGLSWATTERMSKMQNDILQSNIKAQRERVTPIIQRILETFLALTGDPGAEFDIDWSAVILLDEETQSKARLANWQATEIMLRCIIQLRELGWTDEDAANQMLHDEGIDVSKLPKGWLEKAYEQRNSRELLKGMFRELVE